MTPDNCDYGIMDAEVISQSLWVTQPSESEFFQNFMRSYIIYLIVINAQQVNQCLSYGIVM